MFRQFTRLPLRRYIHSPPRQKLKSTAFPLAAGVALAYFAWRWTPDRHDVSDTPPMESPRLAPQVSSPSSSTSWSSLSPPQPQEAPSLNQLEAPFKLPEEPNRTSNELQTVSDDSPSQSQTRDEDSEPSSEGTEGGAFNPVTGEINWDCPCLGGMAHGICGPQFREAFSCFVFSEKDPKGIDCVDKFKGMQDCFREHPDIYGDEIMDEEEDENAVGDAISPPSTVDDGQTRSPMPASPSEQTPPATPKMTSA